MATESFDQGNIGMTETASPTPRKKSIFKRILLGVAAIVAALIVVIAMQPSEFRVSRSATMAAPAPTVFEQVNNFHNWEDWSPWAKIDPAAKNSFEGPTSGTGAIFRWNGNSEVGEGSSTIVESRPNDLIRIQLDFVRPFAGTSDVTFTFKPEADQTAVTWSMAGKNNFIAKAVHLVMDCETMVGGQFEQGLANMKRVVERTP